MDRIIICGAGYSLKSGIELNLWDKIKDIDILSINFCYRFMPYAPNMIIWGDDSVWIKCEDSLSVLSQYGVKLYSRIREKYNKYPFINQLRVEDEQHNSLPFTDNMENIYMGRCGFTGLMALSLACGLNYEEIYLLGYDFGNKDSRDRNTHWYQDMDDKINIGAYGIGSVYLNGNKPREEISDFNAFLNSKAKIYNVSPQSNIEVFEKLTYPELFNKIK
jgi:hypothetical protein